MTKSAWNNSDLPLWWQSKPPVMKAQAIAFLQGRTLGTPIWWSVPIQQERLEVVLHLCATGSVSSRLHWRVASYGPATLAAARKAESLRRHVSIDIETHSSPPYQVFQGSTQIRPGMLYPPPNGGKRVLPSVYTKLTDRWLRANGVYNRPEMMNQGHLKNCVALLNESHMNFVDKVTHMLGKMHAHLGNRPDLQVKLIELFHDFEALQVDELYPIVELLASYIELTEDDVEFNKEDFDTPDLDKW